MKRREMKQLAKDMGVRFLYGSYVKTWRCPGTRPGHEVELIIASSHVKIYAPYPWVLRSVAKDGGTTRVQLWR